MFYQPVPYQHLPQLTGLCVVNGQLFCHKEKVQTVGIETCLNDFKEQLQKFSKPLFVCHNRKVFDSKILVNTLMNSPLCGALHIEGFVDSLHVYKEIYQTGIHINQNLLLDTMSYNEHLAVEDVKIMQSLVLHHNFSSEDLLKHSFSLDNVTSSLARTFKTSECLNSLQPLVGCISSYIMKKKSTIAKLASHFVEQILFSIFLF